MVTAKVRVRNSAQSSVFRHPGNMWATAALALVIIIFTNIPLFAPFELLAGLVVGYYYYSYVKDKKITSVLNLHEIIENFMLQKK